MQSHSVSKPLILAVSLVSFALLAAAAVPPVQVASDPGVKCGQAVAKTMSVCLNKAIKTHVVCYKKTGAVCSESDSKLTKAFSKASETILKKCENQAAVERGWLRDVCAAGPRLSLRRLL